MSDELIKKLRKCSKKERKNIAIKLAQKGNNEYVQELINMVKTKHRYFLKWYNFQDQLIGIDALGESKNPKALNYLKELIKKKGTLRILPGNEDNPYIYGPREKIMDIEYINAKGQLKNALEGNLWLPGKEIPNVRNKIETAIKKLEESLI